MKASEKYKSVFGSIDHLSDQIPWTAGVSSLVEHLLWDTKSILGISKTSLIRQIVQWVDGHEDLSSTLDEKTKYVNTKLRLLSAQTNSSRRYDKPKASYCGPREALRRLRFFSEDYLNKEFDIFLGLASDKYLDSLYGTYLDFQTGGHWTTHGNGGLFGYSTGIDQMFMDNLAYNHDMRLLVANELKLGGKKNKDQLLKYSFMRLKLEEIEFIACGTDFLLLFIGDKHEQFELSSEIDNEIEYCRTPKGKHLLNERIVEHARNMRIESMTWSELLSFNNDYAKNLGLLQQVEEKLLSGFATALNEKAILQ